MLLTLEATQEINNGTYAVSLIIGHDAMLSSKYTSTPRRSFYSCIEYLEEREQDLWRYLINN